MKDLNHPYKEFEETQLWNVIENALDALVENQDIELTTKREYVIGYLCKSLKSKLKIEDE